MVRGAGRSPFPYVWFLGRGVGAVGDALATGALVGTLLAVFLTALGLLVSVFAGSNRVSLSVSLFVLLALFAPTQFPTSAKQGWAGDLFLRANPMTAGEHYVGKIVVDGHSLERGRFLARDAGHCRGALCDSGLVAGARFMRLSGDVSR